MLRGAAGDLWLHWRALPNTDFSLRRPQFPPLTTAAAGHLGPFAIPAEFSLVTVLSTACQDAIDWHFDAFFLCRRPELNWDTVGHLIKRRSFERARLEEVREVLNAEIPERISKTGWTRTAEQPLIMALRAYRNSRATRL